MIITMIFNGTIYSFPDQGRKQPWYKLFKLPIGLFGRTIGLNYSMFVLFFPKHIRVAGPFREYSVQLLHVTDMDSMPSKKEGGAFPRLHIRLDEVPGMMWILI